MGAGTIVALVLAAVVGVAVVCILAVTLLGTTAEPQFTEIPLDAQGSGSDLVDTRDVVEQNAQAMQFGLAQGEYEELYGRLHPEHQERISAEHFLRCADTAAPGPVEPSAVAFGGTVREPQTAEGTDAYAVPLETSYVDASGDGGSWAAGMHLVELRGTWWWLADISAFSGGDCPEMLTLDGPG